MSKFTVEKIGSAIIAGLLLVACCTTPISAATKYIDSSPDLSAAISGTNEFSPGQDATISVIVQNNGLNTFKFVDSGTIERDDLPNTAKLVTIGLSSGNLPVMIKTDPQRVGDIMGTGTVTVKIHAKILNNATEGQYELPLIIQYKYLASSDQEASENILFMYKPVTQTIPLVVKIKPRVDIEVLEATSENLNVGTEGYLHLKIKNIGSENGKQAIVKIIRNGQSPIIPTDSSVFVGEYPSGGVIECRYKVSVSRDAEKQTYPIDVLVTYQNREGTTVTSSPATIGVPVGGKTDFAITSAPPQIPAGSRITISVQYRNNGDTTIYNAQARITPHDPFTSNDNSAYLGDLKPGEVATAHYDMSVDETAEPKEYSLDSEIRYRDALDNSQISDPVKVRVQVTGAAGKSIVSGLTGSPLTLGIILMLVSGIVVFTYRQKKGSR